MPGILPAHAWQIAILVYKDIPESQIPAFFWSAAIWAYRLGAMAVEYKSQYRLDASITICNKRLEKFLQPQFGSFGGFKSSASLRPLSGNSLESEMASFPISNGAQLLYSLLYLLLTYNITLISIERDWGRFEKQCHCIWCTIVKGDGFDQSYLLQLPKKVLYPLMTFSATMHWLLGQAISTTEII